MANLPRLKWKRSESVEFPRVWHTFKAEDIENDRLIEYRIQDLPLDRVDDYYEHLLATYIADAPVGQPLAGEHDPYIYEDYRKLGNRSSTSEWHWFASKKVPMKSSAQIWYSSKLKTISLIFAM